MKQTDFCDVPDERWRRIELLLVLFTFAEYGERIGIDAQWQAWTARCCRPRRALKISKTEGLGRNPIDRGRSGSKIHLHVDGQGIPLG